MVKCRRYDHGHCILSNDHFCSYCVETDFNNGPVGEKMKMEFVKWEPGFVFFYTGKLASSRWDWDLVTHIYHWQWGLRDLRPEIFRKNCNGTVGSEQKFSEAGKMRRVPLPYPS